MDEEVDALPIAESLPEIVIKFNCMSSIEVLNLFAKGNVIAVIS